MIALQPVKHAVLSAMVGAALAAGLILLLLVGMVAMILPAVLTLLLMAFGEARRRLRGACSRLTGGKLLSRTETLS